MKAPSRSVAWEQILPPATLLLVGLIAAVPLWGPGLLNTRGGGDSPFLLLRTHQLAANLRAGVFPVRWMPDAAYGFGYPFFSYYAALPYYLAAGLTLISLDILTAIKLTQTVFLAAASLAMFYWARVILRSGPGAWLAAVAYTVAPFHLVNVYVRGDSLSEFAAFAFYPLVLLGLDRLAAFPSMRRVALPSLAYAGLIVTHNASALIFSPFVLLYVALHVARLAVTRTPSPRDPGPGNRPRKAVTSGGVMVLALVLGLLVSAWFWLPALTETEYVQLGAQTTGYFFYGNHFRGFDLVQPSVVFDFTTGADRTSPFAMGAVQAGLALTGLLVAIGNQVRRYRARRDTAGSGSGSGARRPIAGMDLLEASFVVVGLLVATWLITPVSRIAWENLPLLPLVQFPWRFLSVQAVFLAVTVGTLLVPAQQRWGLRVAWVLALAFAALAAIATLWGLRAEYIPIRADEVNVERLQLYEAFTGNVGSTIRHEYLPRWVEPRPYVGPSQVEPEAPARAAPVRGELVSSQRIMVGPTRRSWQVEAGSGGADVSFPLYYWPGWQAVVDGRRVQVQPVSGSGYLSVEVPAGLHTVELGLGRTPLRLAAELVSLAAGVAILGLGVLRRQRGATPYGPEGGGVLSSGGPESGQRLRTFTIYSLPFVATLALLVAFHPRVTTESSRDLAMDFDRIPYLHHGLDGVVFDGRRLTGYDYSATEIAPGETLNVTLDWERTRDAEAETASSGAALLRLVSPAAVRGNTIPPLDEAHIDFEGEQGGVAGSATVGLKVPRDAPPGIHLLEMGASTRKYLQPVFVTRRDSKSDGIAVATFADGRVRLDTVDARQPAADRLDVRLDWSTDNPLAANYGLRLSLIDVAGNEWLRQGDRMGYNSQPGLGYLPTSLWPVGRIIDDHHLPGLQPGIPPGDRYVLTVNLYEVSSWTSVGKYVTGVTLTEAATQPDAPILADLGEGVGLSRLDVPRSVGQGERLQITAYWLTSRRPAMDFDIEWRLEIPERGITAYGGTQPMAPGSLPTGWPADGWVAGRVALPIPPLAPPGDHRLSLALRNPGDGTVHGTYVYPEPIQIRELERVWELPDPDRRVGAQFGGMIELAGYGLSQESDSVALTLHWRALSTPDKHLTYFVHLAVPDTGQPVVQLDTMPRSYTYPTGMWAPGEIVSEEVSLSVRGVEGGQYELAVGWYDPDTMERLPAVDRRGEPVTGDRLVLPDSILVD